MRKKNTVNRFENPKVYTPYRYRRPNVIRLRGSVLLRIIGPTLFIAAFSAVVTTLYTHTSLKLGMSQSFSTLVGFVVSLLLAYRTNTAYDRYWEGRRLWSTMTVAIRNIARCIWVNVDERVPKDLLEKKTAINLLLGFAVATKHYLREEDGVNYDDLKPFIADIQSDLPGFIDTQAQSASKEGLSSKQTTFKWLMELMQNNSKATNPMLLLNHNLPLTITLYLSSYIRTQKTKSPQATDDGSINLMYANLSTMVDCLTNLERVLRSPIPRAYAIHLSQTTWVYCLALPFQLVSSNGWNTILITFLVSAVLLGVEKIAEEIENPFGIDENDLDLDDFCGILRLELSTITAHKIPSIDEWMYSPDNRVFENNDISVQEASKQSFNELRNLLSDENEKTRLSVSTERLASVNPEEQEKKEDKISINVEEISDNKEELK
ncbi:9996_t:CDS:2 [Acaulospora morrowiae]|uniref:9996_t:CDS:1 n=1 Tax=Acaulospora morrowiae TaxID=94023 RepID=A0A9N9BMV3_9GLOM|nr:9996_t:CDS:2 [Acaulospora morrowiae]